MKEAELLEKIELLKLEKNTIERREKAGNLLSRSKSKDKKTEN